MLVCHCQEVRVGCYCLAPFTDEDNVTEYYRTKIINRTIRMAKVIDDDDYHLFDIIFLDWDC